MWRSMYWDAFWMWKSSKETFAISIANKAIKLVDTVKYEYDYRRIQRLLLNCIVDKKHILSLIKNTKNHSVILQKLMTH